jgi:glycosyltransferase involved in cell wall biosynthesis
MMNDKVPQVSIGVPLYNAESFLREALEAMTVQTFTYFEVVISDNASTDATADICREFAARDPRFRVFRNEKNMGAAYNFNRVFELSRAPLFRWAAYDDVMGPRALEVCVEALRHAPDAALAYPKTVLIDEASRPFEEYEDMYQLDEEENYRRFAHFLRVVEERNCHPVFGLIRRDVLAQTPLLGNYHSADKVLLGRLALLGRFIEVPDRQFYRRKHGKVSVAVNKTAKDFAVWFDTSLTGKAAYPRLRRAKEFFVSIAKARMSPLRKLQCLGYLAGFYLRAEAWQSLWKMVSFRRK